MPQWIRHPNPHTHRSSVTTYPVRWKSRSSLIKVERSLAPSAPGQVLLWFAIKFKFQALTPGSQGSILFHHRPRVLVLSTPEISEYCSYCCAELVTKRCSVCRTVWYCDLVSIFEQYDILPLKSSYPASSKAECRSCLLRQLHFYLYHLLTRMFPCSPAGVSKAGLASPQTRMRMFSTCEESVV